MPEDDQDSQGEWRAVGRLLALIAAFVAVVVHLALLAITVGFIRDGSGKGLLTGFFAVLYVMAAAGLAAYAVDEGPKPSSDDEWGNS